MPEALSDEQWTAMRELVEGEPSTHARVAAAGGVYQTSVSRRAASEGWRALDFRRPRVRAAQRAMVELAARAAAGDLPEGEADEADEAPGADIGAEPAVTAQDGRPREAFVPETSEESVRERLARIGGILIRQADLALSRADAGRPLDRRQVAALSAMVQLAERIAVLAREHVAKEKVASDEELADKLRLLDDRIIYLSREGARCILVAHGMSEEEAGEATGKWMS